MMGTEGLSAGEDNQQPSLSKGKKGSTTILMLFIHNK